MKQIVLSCLYFHLTSAHDCESGLLCPAVKTVTLRFPLILFFFLSGLSSPPGRLCQFFFIPFEYLILRGPISKVHINFDCVLFSADQCKQYPHSRAECGWAGITQQQCESKGCCYDESVPNVKWCFRGESESQSLENKFVEYKRVYTATDPSKLWYGPDIFVHVNVFTVIFLGGTYPIFFRFGEIGGKNHGSIPRDYAGLRESIPHYYPRTHLNFQAHTLHIPNKEFVVVNSYCHISLDKPQLLRQDFKRRRFSLLGGRTFANKIKAALSL